MTRARTVACIALVVGGGLLAAFFVTFNALFSDGPTSVVNPERLSTYVISFMTHAILGVMGPMWVRGRWLMWASLAAGPSVLVAALYTLSESNVLLFAAVYIAAALGGALFGAFGGSRFTRPST